MEGYTEIWMNVSEIKTDVVFRQKAAKLLKPAARYGVIEL